MGCNCIEIDVNKQVVPTGVEVLTNQVCIATGSTAFFDFVVFTSDESDLDNGYIANCRVDLMNYEPNSGALDSVSSFTLSKIERICREQDAGDKYRAYITDLSIAAEYDYLICLCLTPLADNLNSIISAPFQVHLVQCHLKDFKFQKINNPQLPEDLVPEIIGNQFFFYTPYIIDTKKLIPSFKTDSADVFVNGIKQVSGESSQDFTEHVEYIVDNNIYWVSVKKSGLPVVFINTPNNLPITSKEEWISESTIVILNNDGSLEYSNMNLSIKGRGNSTWYNDPKNSYSLKLDKKEELFGLPKNKRWVLIANWRDRTLLRNDVALYIAKATGLAWTPSGIFVELILNGKHWGNYYLCEQIRVDKGRLNIREMSENDIEGDHLTGGYLVELDTNFDELFKFKSSVRGLPYMFKYPDDDVLQPAQFNYFKDYICSFEEALYAENWLDDRSYCDYIDLQSFADWWLIHEITMNWEPNHPKSSYMHKDYLGKLCAGPVWDFDYATFCPESANEFTCIDAIYYNRLFQDESFVNIVRERLKVLINNLSGINNYVIKQKELLMVSQKLNHDLWPIIRKVCGDEDMDYDEAVERLISAYTMKIEWLEKQLANM